MGPVTLTLVSVMPGAVVDHRRIEVDQLVAWLRIVNTALPCCGTEPGPEDSSSGVPAVTTKAWLRLATSPLVRRCGAGGAFRSKRRNGQRERGIGVAVDHRAGDDDAGAEAETWSSHPSACSSRCTSTVMAGALRRGVRE